MNPKSKNKKKLVRIKKNQILLKLNNNRKIAFQYKISQISINQ